MERPNEWELNKKNLYGLGLAVLDFRLSINNNLHKYILYYKLQLQKNIAAMYNVR